MVEKQKAKDAPNKHLGPLEVGQILTLSREGLSQRKIADKVEKADGSFGIGFGTVCRVLQKRKREPSWTGERAQGSGRGRSTTPAQDKAMGRMMRRNRGRKKTVAKTVRAALGLQKKVSVKLVQRRLREQELRFLRRRKKRMLMGPHKEERLRWARWVLRQDDARLRRIVYTDGVTFYLAKSAEGVANAKRLALGLWVWREANNKDAMHEDCIGPSRYTKAQGIPVRVWGILSQCQLKISVLPEATIMNRWVYADMIENKFRKMIGSVRNPSIIQDHERALWCDEPVAAYKKVGIELLWRYPTNSADLNAIENVWKMLRDRLDDTFPRARESRKEFVTRLRKAVTWLNVNKVDSMRKYASNMKERAAEVIAQSGGRTQW